ncbi:hypothetical protein BJP34_11070 [Moorena producens PAL-8-15-08-1]|uniref:DUF3944 domain-containing protein n=1 Tax=Moorena producens PAL-8-15-08-1 TaxID=1458985 RepID=A0A1D8TQK5_9CYAN|nr:hypothetical protein [Moorena producens]AOW99919.1 hypothetical protein BJP34_11070 [Moorena producens PAL-8-15-08-1]
MTKLTSEEISNLRSELANNPEALEALDVIEEWDGDLADAAESLATRNGIEGVENNADLRWFTEILRQCHGHICQPKYKKFRENYLPALIGVVAEFLAGSLKFKPLVAGLIATPVAIYIEKEGMENFCKSYDPNA